MLRKKMTFLAMLSIIGIIVLFSSCPAVVNDPTSITADPASVSIIGKTGTLELRMLVNGTQELSATVLPTHATNKTVTWESSNTAVATIDATGLVTAIALGSTVITVKTVNDKTATISIEVFEPRNDATNVEATASVVKVIKNDTGTTLSVVLTPEDSDSLISWSFEEILNPINLPPPSNNRAISSSLPPLITFSGDTASTEVTAKVSRAGLAEVTVTVTTSTGQLTTSFIVTASDDNKITHNDTALLNTNKGTATNPRANGFSNVAGHASAPGGTYRIPAIIQLNDGTLVAAFDIRYRGDSSGSGDVGQATSGSDIAVARSSDYGETWTMVNAIDVDNTFNHDGDTGLGYIKEVDIGDPCLAYDPQTNRLFCFILTGGGLVKNNLSLTDFVYYTSDDGGETWGNRTSLKDTVMEGMDTDFPGTPRAVFTSPGAGIVLKDKTLVVPIQYFTMSPNSGRCGFIYSTDSGTTWSRSKMTTVGNQYSSESSIVQLADGSLFMGAKRETGSTTTYASYILPATDGVPNFTAEWISSIDLTGGRSQFSLETVREATAETYGVIAFCRPLTGSPSRSKVTVSFIKDNTLAGGTVEFLPASDDIMIRDPANAYLGYSSMTMIDPYTLGVLYENTTGMRFQRHNLADKLATWK